MPRDGSGVASWPPNGDAIPNTVIDSSKYNARWNDLLAMLNTAAPISVGGTNATTAIGAADNLSTQSLTIASATTTDLATATGTSVTISGNATITGLGTLPAGVFRHLTFSGAPTLTNSASIVLPGGANIVAAAGDTALAQSIGGGSWRIRAYQRASGQPLPIIGLAVTDTVTVTSADAGAGAGPVVELRRDSASPAVNDLLAYLQWTGRDSAANLQTYAQIHGQILDPVSATEDALLVIETVVAGVLAAQLAIAAGVYTPLATGGAKGAGTFNATEYYKNGARLLLQQFFESTQQTVTSGGALTLAHSLGASPKLYQAYLICTSAEAGYSVNDEVAVNPSIQDSGSDRGLSMVPDATNINVRFGSSSSALNIIRKDTGVRFGITNTSWKLVARAWL